MILNKENKLIYRFSSGKDIKNAKLTNIPLEKAKINVAKCIYFIF
jgi:hypothetical protein